MALAKLENYLIAADGTVKLCDFGSVTTKVVNTATIELSKVSAAFHTILCALVLLR